MKLTKSYRKAVRKVLVKRAKQLKEYSKLVEQSRKEWLATKGGSECISKNMK